MFSNMHATHAPLVYRPQQGESGKDDIRGTSDCFGEVIDYMNDMKFITSAMCELTSRISYS
jgi:hypothetical protein